MSWRSMLQDASRLERLATSDSLSGRSQLYSSSIGSGRAVLTGESPETYGDLDHGSFLEVKNIPGGVEATLAEMDGAGAIVWMWSANPAGELVLEIDGVETTYPFRSFLAGKWLPQQEPFAQKTAEGYNLHFPMPHKNHCRVSVRAKSRSELGAMFYQIAWSALGSEVEVEPFDIHAVRKEKMRLKQLAQRFSRPPEFPFQERVEVQLAPGTASNVLSMSGSGTVQCFKITASSKAQLSQLHVEVFWDGEDAPPISAPLHLLCGVSEAFENIHSLPVTVAGATVTLRWPMPFSDGARFRLSNSGDNKLQLQVAASIDWSRSSPRRFHGCVSNYRNLPADEPNILSLIEVSGRGAIVGCILQVENRSDAWWGEGDPLIWLDATNQPAWRGTGTEDYFGFAWCSTKTFQHPFRGQSMAGPSFAAMCRYHILDPLPFSEWARFEFEAHGIGTGSMDYSALVLWYSGGSPVPKTSNPNSRP